MIELRKVNRQVQSLRKQVDLLTEIILDICKPKRINENNYSIYENKNLTKLLSLRGESKSG